MTQIEEYSRQRVKDISNLIKKYKHEKKYQHELDLVVGEQRAYLQVLSIIEDI
jgi:hypothetical protein